MSKHQVELVFSYLRILFYYHIYKLQNLISNQWLCILFENSNESTFFVNNFTNSLFGNSALQ